MVYIFCYLYLLKFFLSKHAKNIVIHEGNAKITDFGNSKFVDDQTKSHNSIIGILPYIAPEILSANLDKPYPYSKASDIYSLGVLFWEITSCKIPFEGCQHDNALITQLIKGKREECIVNTPHEYRKIYESCWDGSPQNRPNIRIIYEEIEDIYNNLNTNNYTIDGKCLFRIIFYFII